MKNGSLRAITHWLQVDTHVANGHKSGFSFLTIPLEDGVEAQAALLLAQSMEVFFSHITVCDKTVSCGNLGIKTFFA